MDIALPDNQMMRSITIFKCLDIIATSSQQSDKLLHIYKHHLSHKTEVD